MLKKYLFVFLAIAMVLALSPILRNFAGQAQANSTSSASVADATQDQPVLAAMFYSNWCGACQILEPRLEAVRPGFSDRKVDFVTFDFSYALVRGKAIKELAEQKGVPNIYAKNKGRTGFMLLIDPATESVLDIITIRDSKEAIIAKLERSLQRPAPAPASTQVSTG